MMPPRFIILLATALLFSAVSVGCDSGDPTTSTPPPPDDPVVAGIDLDELLAPPTAAEREAVRAELAERGRTVVPSALRIERERSDGDATLQIVSFTAARVAGTGRFYGVVRIPDTSPGVIVDMPVLVVIPEERETLSVRRLLNSGNVSTLGPTFAQVMMAPPGVTLQDGDQAFTSAAPPEDAFSPYDLEVDLLRAFLGATLDVLGDDVDADRIGYAGFGRGGTVALLLATRPSATRFPFTARAVAALKPFTDYQAPSFRSVVRRLLLDQSSSFPSDEPIADRFVHPLRDGALPMADVREAFLRWSPIYQTASLPPVFVRHGESETAVGKDHTTRLADLLPNGANIALVAATGQGLFIDPQVQRALSSFLLDEVADAN